jgi:hypothetical protein
MRWPAQYSSWSWARFEKRSPGGGAQVLEAAGYLEASDGTGEQLCSIDLAALGPQTTGDLGRAER